MRLQTGTYGGKPVVPVIAKDDWIMVDVDGGPTDFVTTPTNLVDVRPSDWEAISVRGEKSFMHEWGYDITRWRVIRASGPRV